MRPPEGERETRPATRSGRIVGLLAAVGFSIAMWAFIAMAILGLALKIIGPKDAEKGLSAAGASMSQLFNLDNKEPDAESPSGSAGDLNSAAGPITTLNGQAVEPAKENAPAAQERAKAPQAADKPAAAAPR